MKFKKGLALVILALFIIGASVTAFAQEEWYGFFNYGSYNFEIDDTSVWDYTGLRTADLNTITVNPAGYPGIDVKAEGRFEDVLGETWGYEYNFSHTHARRNLFTSLDVWPFPALKIVVRNEAVTTDHNSYLTYSHVFSLVED